MIRIFEVLLTQHHKTSAFIYQKKRSHLYFKCLSTTPNVIVVASDIQVNHNGKQVRLVVERTNQLT